jgi:NAD-dependent dihydropyrimidine dehydrogenase PreA subunit
MPDATPCDPEPGRLVPIVDRARCEGKADCVRVCPYDVFVVRRLDADERAALSLFPRLKLLVHGGEQAFVARPDACHACGRCVTACPERAIGLVAAMTLRRAEPAAPSST